MARKTESPAAALGRLRWKGKSREEIQAHVEMMAALAGRPKKPTACPKCGEIAAGARLAREHCRPKKEGPRK